MLDRARIRTLRDAGHTLEEIAATVGVAKLSVQNVLKEPPIKSSESAATPASRGRWAPGQGGALSGPGRAHPEGGAGVRVKNES